MAPSATESVVRHLRRAALRQDVAGLTDGELLQAYVGRRDEAAFDALVRRHGAMVLGVCRRVLRNQADAEDAFQATFLVLVRKAASIRSASAVSSWLYGVAHTTALKAKAMTRKRRTRELEAATLPRSEACEEVWQAVQALLDAELVTLPDKYRLPIVLCDLEGKTIKAAAQQLGWPQGTAATRLTRGRALLARRLAKHGLIVPVGVLTAALSHGTAAASVPPALVLCTVKATSLIAAGQGGAGLVSAKVAALTQGVVQAMFLTKLKLCALGFFALAVLGAGVGSMGHGTFAQEAARPEAGVQVLAGKQVQDDGDPAKLRLEIERLRAELERTRLMLLRAQQELAVVKAEALLNEARARLAEAQESAARKAAQDALKGKLPLPAGAYQPDKSVTQPKAKIVDPKVIPTAVSPDGRIVITAQDAVIIALDVQTGKVLFKSLGHNAPISALAFSPDGKLLVSGGQDKAVTVWDSLTGKQIRKFVLQIPVDNVVFTNEGQIRIIIGVDGVRSQHEFDAATGELKRILRENPAK